MRARWFEIGALMPLQQLRAPSDGSSRADRFPDVSSAVLRGIQCQIGGETEGRAHMLLGNDSFSVPTQPAVSQQDTIAAMQAAVRPHIQSLSCLAQQLWPWHTS